MNYELSSRPFTVEGNISYNLDQAMPFGDMPSSMLMAKFEETDTGNDEGLYDNYARNTLTDWGPDQNKFEHEESRGAVNRRSGRLELQYYGHRGSADDPYRPEHFDGFLGPEDRDPRGINVDPDMRQYSKQQDARMRFLRFSSDSSCDTTGGGRSEAQVMADNQKLIRRVRSNFKGFDRQIDGRRNPLRREFAHKSGVAKQVRVQSYGDAITDYALTPQRRANVVAKEILRNTKGWREETADADFAFAKYTQACRKVRPQTDKKVVLNSLGSDNAKRAEINENDPTKCYKAAGLLMADIVNCKASTMNTVRNGNMDFEEAQETVAMKTKPFEKDLSIVTRAINQDSNFTSADLTVFGKNPFPERAEHIARQTTYNHYTPAHHYLNAEYIIKSVKHGEDISKINSLIITDSSNPQIRDSNTIGGKSAKLRMITGSKLEVEYDAEQGESIRTVSYKSIMEQNGDKRIRLSAYDQTTKESDNTQSRKKNHSNYNVVDKDSSIHNMKYNDNSYKDRRAGGLGSKYTMRYMQRDESSDEISSLN